MVKVFRIKLKIICLLASLVAVASAEVFAAQKSTKPETPTKIKSDIIDVNRKLQTVQFINHVVVEKDDSTMITEKMTVIYHEKKAPKKDKKIEEKTAEKITEKTVEKNEPKESSEEYVAPSESDVWGGGKKPEKSSSQESSSVEKIFSDQRVKIFTRDSVATADSGYYDPNNETFVLEKNVVVNDGTSVAKGNTFVYDLVAKKGHFIGTKNVENSSASQQKSDEDNRAVVIFSDGEIDERKNSKKSKKTTNEQDSSD